MSVLEWTGLGLTGCIAVTIVGYCLRKSRCLESLYCTFVGDQVAPPPDTTTNTPVDIVRTMGENHRETLRLLTDMSIHMEHTLIALDQAVNAIETFMSERIHIHDQGMQRTMREHTTAIITSLRDLQTQCTTAMEAQQRTLAAVGERLRENTHHIISVREDILTTA
jgi:hypothetical protein